MWKAGKVVERWKRHVGFELSKFVHVSKTTAEAIKANKGFINVCHRFRISLDEGIECLRKCPVVDSERYYGTWLFSRKEVRQEKTRQTKVVEVEEIE